MPTITPLPSISARTPLVLVVDDEPKNLQLVGSLLLQKNIETIIAMNGLEALESARTEKPDLVLLDIMMPGMDGYEVCRKLKADPATSDIPVIFLTAKTEEDDLIEAFAAGGMDYVTKPFRSGELLARVATHVSLRRAREDVNRLEKLQARMYAIIARDLRAPFWQLSGFCRLVAEAGDEIKRDSLLEMCGQLERQAYTASALLEDLYKWSSLQLNSLEFFPQVLTIRDLAQEAIAEMRPYWMIKRMSVENKCPADLAVVADSHMAAAVFRDLVSNAVKFTREGGSVTISASRAEKLVRVQIADTGVGIAPEMLHTLFQVDDRKVSRGTSGESGSGLGLVLAQLFVEKHGGTIALDSTLGLGTTVTFTLPAQETEEGLY